MKKKVISSVLALIMLLSFSACNDNKAPTAPKVDVHTSEPLQNHDGLIYGKWQAENGPLYEIGTDGRYANYKDKNNLSDNYYKGKIDILSGVKALADLKITTQQYLDKYNTYAGGYYNMFSLKMHYETFQSEGADKSATLNKEKYMSYLFMISKDNTDEATIINMADSTSTIVKRVK